MKRTKYENMLAVSLFGASNHLLNHHNENTHIMTSSPKFSINKL